MFDCIQKSALSVTKVVDYDHNEVTLSVTYNKQTQKQTLPFPGVPSILMFNPDTLNFSFVPVPDISATDLYIDFVQKL